MVGLALAYLVTLGEPYFWEIMLPGGIVGVIVGYATFVYGGTAGGAFDSVRPPDRVSRVQLRKASQPLHPRYTVIATWATATTSPDQAAYQRRGAWRKPHSVPRTPSDHEDGIGQRAREHGG